MARTYNKRKKKKKKKPRRVYPPSDEDLNTMQQDCQMSDDTADFFTEEDVIDTTFENRLK